ncbi:MAG: cell division protein FtsZ [Epsilonproteobacteria bacterium]|nr:cell division protein FtsZ [Campylobacterota bacterium]
MVQRDVLMSGRISGAVIKVIGVGGGGCNSINTMIKKNVQGVDFFSVNTDTQSLSMMLDGTKTIQIGKELTKGLGAGSIPEIGKAAAQENIEEFEEIVKDIDMLFVAAGMGGGTGTGAAPVIAETAKDQNALTVGVVTKPFVFEGKRRLKNAEQGIKEMSKICDSVIIIPNQKLLETLPKNTSLTEAFGFSDDVLRQAVQGISDLVNQPGQINVDFADVKTVMSKKGMAIMGAGEASGNDRAKLAAQKAIYSPLLDNIDLTGASDILVNITSGGDLSLSEVEESIGVIRDATSNDAELIFGTVIDNTIKDLIKITVIATGFDIPKKHFARRPAAPISVANIDNEDILDIPAFQRVRSDK